MNKYKLYDLTLDQCQETIDEIEIYLVNIKDKVYLFQLIGISYSGQEIVIDGCSLIEFDMKKEKVLGPAYLPNLIPLPNPEIKTFVKVIIKGNDSRIDYSKAREKAENFVAIMKIYDYHSPLIGLVDTYLVPFKDGWTPAYHSTSVNHWDLKVEKTQKLVEHLEQFENHLQNLFDKPVYETISLSLRRYSYAETLPDSAFKLAEIVGCIETLLMKRSDAQNPELNLAEILTQRIYKLLITSKPRFPLLRGLIAEYYDLRSEYTHQSSNDELKEQASYITWIYQLILDAYLIQAKSYSSKEEILHNINRVKLPDWL